MYTCVCVCVVFTSFFIPYFFPWMTLPFQLKWVSNMIQIKFIEEKINHTHTNTHDELHQSKAEHKLNIDWSNCDLYFEYNMRHCMVWCVATRYFECRRERALARWVFVCAIKCTCTINAIPSFSLALSLISAQSITVCAYLLISYTSFSVCDMMWCDEIRALVRLLYNRLFIQYLYCDLSIYLSIFI